MPNKELNNTVDNKIDEELYKQVMVVCRDFVYCWRDKQVEIPEVMRVDLESRLKEFVPKAIKQREEKVIAKLKKDLDDGLFYNICSNEQTLKNYIIKDILGE